MRQPRQARSQPSLELADGQVVPVDGKSLRGSHNRGLSSLHLVSAFRCGRA